MSKKSRHKKKSGYDERSPRESVEVILSRASERWKNLSGSIEALTEALRNSVGDQAFSALVPNLPEHQKELKKALQRFENAVRRPEVVIATTGTTSSGKSTLANLFVGERLLPKAVQEMSAGVVTIRHSSHEHRLLIEKTRGATWTTGAWDDLPADVVRNRLESVMNSYRDIVAKSRTGSEVEPPRFQIKWPTRVGQMPHRFGLPANADITIVDLPGLKYVDDEINGGVVREQARNALCVVAYNSLETDPRKQDALLRQVVDQVKALGGSPARMLFVLNRIDVFRTEDDPDSKERAFCERVTSDIQNRIREALPEYGAEADSIRAIPLSSEPALYAELACRCNGKEQAELLAKLERDYQAIFPSENMNGLPRDHASWTEPQRHWFIQEARVQSRADQFEKHLEAHVAANLPEILLPDLVNGVYHPARQLLQDLDALVEAYSKEERSQLNEAIRHLDDLYEKLRKLQKEALRPLDPLREIVNGGGDLVGKLGAAVPEIEKCLFLCGKDGGPGKLSPLLSALTDAVQVPVQRLNNFVYRLMEGEHVQDNFVDGCLHSVQLFQSIESLRASPLGHKWKMGGEFAGGDVDLVRTALEEFAMNLSKVATELVKREARVQADRMKVALDACATAIVEGLESESISILDDLGFSGLRGVFRGSFELEPPQLPRVKFEADISRWERVEKWEEEEDKWVEKRTWKTLWLKKTWVREKVKVVKEMRHHGISVGKLGDLLEGFEASGGVHELEEFFGNWIVTSIDSFDKSLARRLKDGVQTYRLAFEERKEELERGTQRRIEDADSHRTEVRRVLLSVDENLEWRNHD
jgi:hypothetical protein